jgi:small subunit ribosomal protein S20
MANHFSALKRARQTERRTATNRANTYRQTVSALDKAVQKGTLHGNTASRYKSRLGTRVNAMK